MTGAAASFMAAGIGAEQAPSVWNENMQGHAPALMRLEAKKRFARHQLNLSTPEAWQAYKDGLRARIWRSLGSVYDPALPLNYAETGSIKMNGYSVKNIVYQSRPGFYVTGNLYVPDGDGPFPGVINMHGHWQVGRLAERIQERGHTLAANGYVCLSVDAFGSGERALEHGKYEYHGAMLGGSLLFLGETLMGMQVVDNMRGVDLLCSLPYVDARRIGATGASGGGNQTMWLTAMDDRVAAAVPVVSVGTFESYIMCRNCICELLPDGLTFTEEAGVLALAAPRALKICNGLGDTNPAFQPSEMLRSFVGARPVYQLLGSDDKFSYQVFNLTHGYWPEVREAMLGWFDLHLKGIGHGAPRVEKPFATLPRRDLMIFAPGGRDARVKSIAGYCREQGEQLKNAQQAVSALDEAAKRRELAVVLRVSETAPSAPARVNEYGTASGWLRLGLEMPDGRLLAVLLKPAAQDNGRYTIVCHGAGKQQVPGGAVEQLLQAGSGVVLADLWGQGETFMAGERSPYHELSRSAIWLGETLTGEWSREIAAVGAMLRERYGAKSVAFQGFREAAPAGLYSAALYGGMESVTLVEAPYSYVFAGQRTPEYFLMSLLVPGILRWGDISLAAALAGCPVTFVEPVMMDGSPIPADRFDVWRKELDDARRKLGGKPAEITVIRGGKH